MDTPVGAVPPPPPPSPDSARHARSWRRLWVCAIILAVLLSGGSWLVATPGGFSCLWRAIGWVSGGALSVQRTDGSLLDGFTLDNLHVDNSASTIDIDRVTLDWTPAALWQGQLWIRRLDIGLIRYTSPPGASPTAWPTLPARLALPLRVRVDALRIAGLTLLPENWSCYGLDAAYRYDGQSHLLDIRRWHLPDGNANASLTLADRKPFGVKGVLQFASPHGSANLQASGSLEILRLQGVVQAPPVSVNLDGAFSPFALQPYQRVHRLDLQAHGIDPATLSAGLPRALLDVTAHIEPDGSQGGKGVWQLVNRMPGALSAGRLPLASLDSAFHLTEQSLKIDTLSARLQQGSVQVSGLLQRDQLAIEAHLADVALQGLHQALPRDTVNGRIGLQGAFAALRLDAALKGQGLRADADLAFARQDKGWSWTVSRLVLGMGGGRVSLSGGMDAQQRFNLQGQLAHADPSRWHSGWPQGDINAALSTKGRLAAPLDVALDVRFEPGKLSGAPLSGTLGVEWMRDRLGKVEADLRLGGNRLMAKGAYGAAGDRMQIMVDAPALASLGFGVRGALSGRLDLAGVPSAPQLAADLTARDVHLPGIVTAHAVDMKGELRAGAAGLFHLALTAEQVAGNGWHVESLRARADGTRARHTIELDSRLALAGQKYRAALAAEGGWLPQQSQWRGSVTHASLNGPPDVVLLAPMNVEVGPQRVVLDAARFRVGRSEVRLDGLTRQANGVLVSRGRIEALDLSMLKPWLALPFEQDLSLDAAWNLMADGRGTLTINRRAGDIRFITPQGPLALGLSEANASLDWRAGQTAFNLKIASRQGSLDATGTLSASVLALNASTLQNTRVRLALPDLSGLAAAYGNEAVMGGSLSADLALSGRWLSPEAHGRVDGKDLFWQDRKTGLRLAQGTLKGILDGKRLIIDYLRFESGSGDVSAQGAVDMSGQTPTATIRVAIHQFSVFDRPGRRLVVSGNGALSVTDRLITLTGRIRADQGKLSLPKEGTPSLSDDVIVAGRMPPEPSAFSRLPISVSLVLDLGDQFVFTGQGLNVALSGQVEVNAHQGAAPSARGQVTIIKGKYKAYGQDLDIESGTITFVGALDNPNLNIRARRHLSPVGAGVEVLGSVSAPRLHLIANESLSERDKLAWLVLGHAAGDNAQDSNFLAMAAGSFAAGNLNQQVGLFDELGVSRRQSRTALNGTVSPAEQVLTVGKQLTETLYLGYEYGLSSSEQAVKMMYQLTRGWSVILLIGTDASVESRYTIRFD